MRGERVEKPSRPEIQKSKEFEIRPKKLIKIKDSSIINLIPMNPQQNNSKESLASKNKYHIVSIQKSITKSKKLNERNSTRVSLDLNNLEFSNDNINALDEIVELK